MAHHPLRREILSTHLTNLLINRIGATFVHHVMETDAAAADIVRACMIARRVFGLEPLWQEIDALDNRVPDAQQAQMFAAVARLMARAALGCCATCATEPACRPAARNASPAPRHG